MKTRTAIVTLIAAIAASAGESDYLLGNPRDKAGLAVWAVSRRAGLLFTDSETPDVRVRVAGNDGPATVDFSLRESDGPWHASGQLAFEKGTVELRLPLNLPGRGLYQLDLTAKCGGATSKAQTWLAVVFRPDKPDPASPWGIFYTPYTWFDKALPNGAQVAAEGHRLLGASWSRLNFWAHSFGKVTVTNRKVAADYALWKEMARALRKEGISIMGEIAQCPRELSSRPDDTAEAGDAGPVWCRVKPSDYALWDQLMERLAADFRDEIQVWEVWNEPNLPNRYWTGSVDDFAEHIQHTSQALRRGNPKARIAVAGFVDGHAFADRVLQLGVGKCMDILSVHYTDDRPGSIAQWKTLLKKHALDVPIWNSEERSEVPLRNLAAGIVRSFKFIHVSIGYPEYRPLVRKDWTVLPAGILFSVGAHCIGAGKCIGTSNDVPGCEVYFFQRGDEGDRNGRLAVSPGETGSGPPRAAVVGVLKGGNTEPKLFAKSVGSVTLAAEPLDAARPLTVTDAWGRSRPLKLEGGQGVVPLAGGLLFINGARKLAVAKAAVSQVSEGVLVFEAEGGQCSKGWGRNPKAGFSEGRILEIWAPNEPDAQGYWAELKLAVPAAGRYELLFSGNALSRLAAPRTLSPFAWSLDGGEEHKVDGPTPMIHDVPAAPEGLSVLGTFELAKGDHKFRLRLTARRDEPDRNYALWFDALALRRKQ